MCSVPALQQKQHDVSNNITAPRVPNNRFATQWTNEGMSEYNQLASSLLSPIREVWGSTQSNANISLLLSTTYTAMNMAAKATNRVIMLGEEHNVKAKTNPDVSAAAKLSLQELNNVRQLETSAVSTLAEMEAVKQRLADISSGKKSDLILDKIGTTLIVNCIISLPILLHYFVHSEQLARAQIQLSRPCMLVTRFTVASLLLMECFTPRTVSRPLI